ncbi:MAG TPA: glycosyltransferase [Thermoanaerobaculia bacterium]|nr:glycosyltransferase [Thermoanaerobaculia bacterium]
MGDADARLDRAAVTGLGQYARFFRRGKARTTSDVDWVSGAAMALRAEVWRDAGPLDERYRFYCQDLEFCLRARGAGWRVRIVDEARVTHGHGRTIAPDHIRRHDPVRLRDDLLTWGTAHYGKAWGRVARAVLTAIRRS